MPGSYSPFARRAYALPPARGYKPPTPSKGGGDIIRSIFADGTDGFYFDFSKTDRLFQDLVNTPADGPGENIWLGLESHSWGGKSLVGLIAAQPEARGSGAIALLGTATAATYNTSTGDGTVSRVDASNQSYVTFSPAVGTHRLEIAVTGVAITVRNQTAAGTVLVSSIAAGTTGVVYVSAASQIISINAQTAGTASFNVVSLKAIPGNHGLQATTAAQPKWQTGGLARFDGSDDNLLTTLTASNTGMTLLAKAKLAATGGNRGVMGVNGADGVSRCFLAFDVSGYAAGGVGSDSLSTIKGNVDRSGAYCVLGLTVDASNWRLYEQGVQTNTGAKNGSCNTTLGIPLGSLNANGVYGTFLNADVTHALAIKKVLTAAQIAAITNQWGTT